MKTKESVAQHTPGPWRLETVKTSCGVCHKIGEFPASGVRGYTYACVYEDGTSSWKNYEANSWRESVLFANARLIAAAPELLEAARFARSVILANGAIVSELSERLAVKQLDAAIEKVEGAQ